MTEASRDSSNYVLLVTNNVLKICQAPKALIVSDIVFVCGLRVISHAALGLPVKR